MINLDNIGIDTSLDTAELFKVIHVEHVDGEPSILRTQSLTTGLPAEISAADFWVILDALPA